MSTLPLECYHVKQIREMEALAISAGIDEDELMHRAGSAAFEAILGRYPDAKHFIVLCGGGNNGGDAYVLASLAKAAGKQVTLYHCADPHCLPAAAKKAAEHAREAGVLMQAWEKGGALEADVIVDALLGIGVVGDVRDPYRELIRRLSDSAIPVIALDLPSGINADTGAACGVAVNADLTITFIAMKQGLLTGNARHYAGDIMIADLELPDTIKAEAPLSALQSDLSEIQLLFRPRRRDAHKGNFGHVLIVGGDHGMAGAARMAGEAAGRAGAGLVSVATHKEHVDVITVPRPELMCHGVECADDLNSLLERATVLVLGPGLGESDWSQTLFSKVISCTSPKVVDASALNLLSKTPSHSNDWILTPHPGEAARLLDTDTTSIQADRFQAAKALQDKYGGVIVLKGAGTIIYGKEQLTEICTAGNPGMASGGMGDCLSGIMGALLAQGFSLFDAARAAVSCHAHAADAAATEHGERGLLALDVLEYLRRIINPV